MCGIVGTVNHPLLQETIDCLAHRGPDGTGSSRIDLGEHSVALGHRRLAIVDPSDAGSQPMSSDCGRYYLIFNGEIYNHRELRAGLRHSSFRGHSDTETLLYCLAERGIEALDELNGIFALAFLDTQQCRLLLARDAFGVKPLYYTEDGVGLGFASELRALRELIAEPEVDTQALSALLRLRFVPAPRTLLSGVRKLRPGHVLEVDLSRSNPATVERPYTGPHHAGAEGLSFDDAVTRYGELLEASVQRQLMADVEVGVLLSGGIDSALVAASAASASGRPVKAFTVGFSERDQADETEAAAETARYLGLRHYQRRINRADFIETLGRCIEIVEEPLATTSIIPMYHLAALASEHVKVVLSGQGADEPLGGYPRYRTALLAPWVPPGAASLLGRGMATVGVRDDRLLRGAATLAERGAVERAVAALQVFDEADIRALTGLSGTHALEDVRYVYEWLGCAGQATPVEQAMSLDLRLNLADDLLLYTDKISMHFSLECRVPMLDRVLIRWLEALPAQYRVRLRGGKRIHKAYARRRLPAEIVDRRKKGFASPTRRWFKDTGILREMLLSTDSRMSCYFDPQEIERVLGEHAAGYDRQRQIFLLLSIQQWLDRFARASRAEDSRGLLRAS